jgi:methyltransferase family protein
MQEVAVRHALSTLHRRHVDFGLARCIDVGGSRNVFLVRAPAPSCPPATLLGRVRHRLRRPLPAPLRYEVTRNPILDAFRTVTLLDHGFTGDLLDTGSDLRGDFLDEAFISSLRDSFEVVLSFDTLEHVDDPFRFCRHLVEIAASGGHIYVQTVFSWEYHPSPQDYFRYSPEGLRVCFRGLRATVLDAGWIVEGVSTFIVLKKAV